MMKKIFAVALGILTAIGGFVDIGDLVTNAVVGVTLRPGARLGRRRRRGRHLPVRRDGRPGRGGQRPGDVRDHPRAARARGPGSANLAASFLINLLTLTAEIGGVALALQLASGVGPMLWIPVAAFAVWLVIWRMKFSIMENVAGLLGLTLIVFAVALFLLASGLGRLWPPGVAAVRRIPTRSRR